MLTEERSCFSSGAGEIEVFVTWTGPLPAACALHPDAAPPPTASAAVTAHTLPRRARTDHVDLAAPDIPNPRILSGHHGIPRTDRLFSSRHAPARTVPRDGIL
ncbi:hypothetical protein [Streptomyces nanshensis]|uniref:hypothetical protein n=1 Tax=Streptomyces nanshensis TaxID=518642 RepID=UPI000AA3C8BD